MTAPDFDSRSADALAADELVDAWPFLSVEERVEGFRMLPPSEAENLFLGLGAREQTELLLGLPPPERQLWIRQLPPDDAADLIQQAPEADRAAILALIDPDTRREVTALLAYAEDDAGGLMSPRYARLRADMTVDEAISYLRRQARERLETIYYIYVLDADQRLIGVVSFRDLFAAPPDKTVRDVMRTQVVTVPDDMDQEAVSDVIAQHDLMAVPVVDGEGRIKGIVTVDDIVDVVREEATEDIQKIGGSEALDLPYWQTAFRTLVRKRAGWLTILFLGEMLTATAMSRFQDEISRAVVLALFLPLIISSGGNSGSQASTLIVRAMALGEVRLRDVLRVMQREIASGLVLGMILATIGVIRINVWQALGIQTYPPGIALTVGLALIGVVAWGTLAGAMLPFLLRRLGFDPASASAPFVATLVDVSGLIIYFSVAQVVLRGTLL
jgi:magnesium transporter